MYTISAIGQDSHRFDAFKSNGDNHRLLVLGGVEFLEEPPLQGNSDADVVLHALCRAISGITGVEIIGDYANQMRNDNHIIDSALYVKEAMKYLVNARIVHTSFSIECVRPKIFPFIDRMRSNIANIIGTKKDEICITATSGEGLTDFGRGLGIQALCIITVLKNRVVGIEK